jgi:hypothetical protein
MFASGCSDVWKIGREKTPKEKEGPKTQKKNKKNKKKKFGCSIKLTSSAPQKP